MKRRHCLLGAALAAAGGAVRAQVPAWSLEAQQRLVSGFGADPTQALALRQQLVQAAETALSVGDAAAAEAAFDRAAGMVHSADVEMGLVRAYMQAGDYRRALNFASHAAGAHRNVPAGTALYAWLLQVGGQGVAARRFVDEARERSPDDAALLQVSELLKAGQTVQPAPLGVLLVPPLRAAPFATGAAVPSDARVVGTAWLQEDGSHALVPPATLTGARLLWLRNAMGQTVSAQRVPVPPDSGCALLRLDAALPTAPALAVVPRDPFAGSPAFTFEYAATASNIAAWPQLLQGFFGRAASGGGARLLNIDLAPGSRGGPVFDSYGRVAGLCVPGLESAARLLPAMAIHSIVPGPAAAAPPLSSPSERTSVDRLYEVGMRMALQVLVHS